MAGKRWIERLMDAERGPARAALLTVGCTLIAVVLFLGCAPLSALVDGAHGLDAERVERFGQGSPAPFLAMILLFALAAAASLGLAHSSALRRRTGLGRRIAREGDFREICREINRQAANPLFECSGATVMRDWLVLKTYTPYVNQPVRAAIAPARDVTRLDVALDADEDGLYACRFDIAGWADPFTIHLDGERAGRLRAAVGAMAGREMAL